MIAPADKRAIRKAVLADADRIGTMLARAFDDDPFINFLMKQDRTRTCRIASWAQDAATVSIDLSETYVTEDYSGAALWTPPEQAHHLGRFARYRRISRFAGPIGALRLSRALDMVDACDPVLPHFYLRIIGVEPDQQRRGIASRLMQPVLARCDAERIPAYLFSTKVSNLPLYERHGFAVTERLDLPDGPAVWTMWREPR